MRSPARAALVAAVVVGAVTAWSTLPASPRPADVPADEFSEARAWPVVERLARTKRVAGTEQADDALRYLETQLRAIPELEVEVQDLTAYAVGPYSGPSIYTVRNVVARLPGTDLAHESVLVAAHYDSAVMSHGAADDALACAAVVEAARNLAAGPRSSRSIVFLLDEGEELGLFGAQGFLRHPWARDVVTYVNLEAAGCRGRPILFQTGPGDPWFASAYARGAPHPHGTVLGQDVFQSGVIPSDTDFRVYRDEGHLRGLDVALYRDGWGYHTTRDRIERLEPGSLQEMGDNTLGVLRELASMDIPSGHLDTPAVYYDIAGVWMLSYGSPAAWLLALVALASLGHALWRSGRECGIGALEFLSGAGWMATALGLAIVVTSGLASILDLWRVGVSGWYARPWLAVAAYGLPACLVVLLTARAAVLRSHSTPVSSAVRLAGGAGIVFAVLLAVATWYGVGSGYIALWWVVGATAALRLAALRRLATALVVGCVFPGLLLAEAADALLATFVPIAGRMHGPMEHVIAALAAVPLALGLLLPAAILATAPPRWGRAVLRVAAVAALVACVGVAAMSPYTVARAQRAELALIQDWDRASGETTTEHDPFDGGAADITFPAARLVVVGEGTAPDDGFRRVHVALDPKGATGVYLAFPPGVARRVSAGEGAAWEGPQVNPERPASGPNHLAFVAPPREGLRLTIDLRSDEPVEVQLHTWHTSVPEAFQRLVDDLPDWIAPEPEGWVRSTERL